MSVTKEHTIGIVGLGVMGGAIARNLVERGWSITGYDPDERRVAEAKAAGVTVVANVGDLAKACETILTSLPSAKALDAVIREIAETAPARRLVAELSTFTLEEKAAAEAVLAGKGHGMLDCPLSGTGAQAQNRDLVVYASGRSEDIASLELLFADFAREAHDVGVFGNGMRMKFVANLLVAINNVASAEAMVLGMKAGLDPHQIIQLVSAGAGNSRIFELRAPLMADRAYEPATMSIGLWQKDMKVIDAFARSIGCPTPVFNSTEAIYRAALSNGLEKQDTAAVCTVFESMAGLKR